MRKVNNHTTFTPSEKQELLVLAAKKRARKITPVERRRLIELGANDFAKRFFTAIKELSRG